MRRRSWLLKGACAACLVLPTARGQGSDLDFAVTSDEAPAELKVLVRVPCEILLEPKEGARLRRKASPMEFFFVLPKPGTRDEFKLNETADGWYYRVHTRDRAPRDFQYGYIHSRFCTPWWHREAVGFLPRGDETGVGRQLVRFYDDENDWQDGFARFPDPDASGRRDEFAVAREPRTLGNAGFVMPVLTAEKDISLEFDESLHDLYEVAFITIPRTHAIDAPQQDQVLEAEAILSDFSVDIVFCIDDSSSMDPWFDVVSNVVRKASDQLRGNYPSIQDRFRFGLVTYRDAGNVQVVCDLSQGAAAEGFLAKIDSVRPQGGGDEGEDVLGGIHRAITGMDWSEVAFKTIVLVGDEVGYAPEHNSEQNSSGMGIDALIKLAQPVEEGVAPIEGYKASKVIMSIELMGRDVNGTSLARLRSQQFSELTKGPFKGEHIQLPHTGTEQLEQLLVEAMKRQIDGAQTLSSGLSSGDLLREDSQLSDPRFAGIPAPFRGMIEILKPTADDTDDLSGMQSGWISAFDTFGQRTVSERFLVSKSRLQKLQNTIEFVALGLDQPDMNPTALINELRQRLSSMSIDADIGPETPIATVFAIVSGLPIQTPLMMLTPEQFKAKTPKDREQLIKKMEEMSNSLDDQLHNQPSLWFKLDANDEDRDAVAFVSIADFK